VAIAGIHLNICNVQLDLTQSKLAVQAIPTMILIRGG
jgi:hypothetical protein